MQGERDGAGNLGRLYADARDATFGEEELQLTIPEQQRVFQLWRERSAENWEKILSGDIHLSTEAIKTLISMLIEDVMEEAFSRLLRNDEIPDVEAIKHIIEDKAKKTLEQYQDLLERSMDVERQVHQFLEEGTPVGGQEKEKITQSFLRRAGKIVFEYAQSIKEIVDFSGSDFPGVPAEKFLQVSNELEVLKGFIEALYKQTGRLDIESVRGFEFGYSEEDREAILDMAKESYPGESETEKGVISNLQFALDDKEADMHVLKKDGQAIAFIYFLPRPSVDGREHCYAGGLNVDPKFQGVGIGEVFVERLVKEKAQSAVVEAVMVPSVELLQRHLEKTGFVITGIRENSDGTFFFTVELDETINTRLVSKQPDFQLDDAVKIIEFTTRMELGSDHVANQIRSFTDEGRVGTRYMKTEKGFAVVFE